MKFHVYVVSGNEKERVKVSALLKSLQYSVESFSDPEECVQALVSPAFQKPRLILVDEDFASDKNKSLSGLELLRICRLGQMDIPVILLSQKEVSPHLVIALREGAWDYLSYPLHATRLKVSIDNLLNMQMLNKEIRQLQKMLDEQAPPLELLGESAIAQKVIYLADKAAGADVNVLIYGEFGVGKEMVSRYIHTSSRRSGHLVSVNCSSFSKNNELDMELFGFEKDGKFREGRILSADKGTLYISDIEYMPLSLQGKLLKFVSDGTAPCAEGKYKKVDVRLIVSTTKDIQQVLSDGLLREDLYFRLNVFSIHIPPLIERPEDIRGLAKYFLFEASDTEAVRGISDEAYQILEKYNWSGNMRQLKNVIQRALLETDSAVLDVQDFSFLLLEGSGSFAGKKVFLTLEEIEKKHIKKALLHAQGNMSKASKMLGIARSTLYRRVDDLKL